MGSAGSAARPSAAFSLLMAIYAGDRPSYLSAALKSILESTLLPAQIVLVQDGPVSGELIETVEQYQHALCIERIVLSKNVGLGLALQQGLQQCKHELVARFDSDDILLPSRFAEQLDYFALHPETSVLGTWIGEFENTPDVVDVIRQVPLESSAIARYARMRNPMNHMTVVFRKGDVLNAGGYRNEIGYEDYSLWARMLSKGFILANLPTVSVLARAGSSMIARRGGWRYARLEFALQGVLYRSGLISKVGVLRNLLLRVPARLIPASLLSLLYKTALRRNF